MYHLNVYSFILGQPLITVQLYDDTTGCHKKDFWICNYVWGRVWAPQAVCLRIHQSTPNQILLHRRLSPHCPDISRSVQLQGVQDKVKGLRFSNPPPSPTKTPSPNPLTLMTNPGQDQPHFPPPHLNLKPFIFSVFVFSKMQSWKHFALLFLRVNMWMIICYKNVKYVKDHSLFWKNLHLSFWR